MAVLKDRKRDYYALKQSLRDEAGAPVHLDSAGDLLIRDLAKKQGEKSISLEQQLKIRQKFEKGSQLKPWTQSGLTTLENFQKTSSPTNEESSSLEKVVDSELESMKDCSGLSRHELELVMAEKPGSRSSLLYRFALGNRKEKIETNDLVSKLDRHPLNRLKEIEEEVFGKKEAEGDTEGRKKKRRKRKRIKNRKEIKPTEGVKPNEAEKEGESSEEDVTSHRPSLWDVRDMKKFCKNEQQGCQVQKLYTVRDGKIVQISPQLES